MSITRAEHIVNFTAWVTVTTTACFLAAQALLLGAFLVNGDEGISDTWVGYTSATRNAPSSNAWAARKQASIRLVDAI